MSTKSVSSLREPLEPLEEDVRETPPGPPIDVPRGAPRRPRLAPELHNALHTPHKTDLALRTPAERRLNTRRASWTAPRLSCAYDVHSVAEGIADRAATVLSCTNPCCAHPSLKYAEVHLGSRFTSHLYNTAVRMSRSYEQLHGWLLV